jgi:hypothetical protein
MGMPSFVFDGKTGLEETGIVHRIRRVEDKKTVAGGMNAQGERNWNSGKC